MKIKIFFLALLMFLFNYKLLSAETLTLSETLKKALKENHYIKAKNYEFLSKEKDLYISKYSLYPKIYLEEKFTTGNYNSYGVFTKLNQETLTMTNFFNPGTVSNFHTSINLEMPLYVRELFVNREMKKSFFLSSKNDLGNFREEIAFQAFKAYLGLLKAKAYLDMVKKSLEEAEEVYRVAKVRVKNGLAVSSDELRAFVYLKERQSALIKAENDLKIAKKALGVILSEEKDYDVLEETLKEDNLPILDDLIKEAMKNRKDLMSNKYNIEALKHLVEIEKSKYYPKVYLALSYLNDGRSFPMQGDGSGYVAGINLRWDIFDKTRNDGKDKALSEAHRLKEIVNQMEKEIIFRVKESYYRVEETKKRFELAQEALKEAEETYRLIKLRYQNDLAKILELIDAETALNIARNSIIISQYDYFEAIGKCLYEAGIFTKNIIKE